MANFIVITFVTPFKWWLKILYKIWPSAENSFHVNIGSNTFFGYSLKNSYEYACVFKKEHFYIWWSYHFLICLSTFIFICSSELLYIFQANCSLCLEFSSPFILLEIVYFSLLLYFFIFLSSIKVSLPLIVIFGFTFWSSHSLFCKMSLKYMFLWLYL